MSSNLPGHADVESTIPKWMAIGLTFVILFSVLAPWPVMIWNQYGDADAAWDGVVALLWSGSDQLPTETGVFVEERFRSSPLSIWVLRTMLRHGWVEPSSIPRVMNIATALAGSAIPALLWVLLFRLQLPTLPALVLLLSSPVFFRLRCYGFPTLPSFALFLGSLVCFEGAKGRLKWPGLAISFVMLVVAVAIKVDVILLAPAFILISWFRKLGRPAAWSAWIMPMGAILCWHLFCRTVAPAAPQTAETLQNWSAKWRVVPAGLIDRTNLLNMAMAPGFGTLALAMTGLFATLVRRKSGFLVAVIVLIAPTLLFWGMREMNSSRHNFWIVVPLALLASAALTSLPPRVRALWLPILVAAAAMNYWIGPRQEDFRLAPARFYAAGRQRAETMRRYDEKYDAMFRSLPGSRLCLHSMREETAHALAVWLTMSDRNDVRVVGKHQNDWRVHSWRGGVEYRLWMPDQDQPIGDGSQLQAQGWIVQAGG